MQITEITQEQLDELVAAIANYKKDAEIMKTINNDLLLQNAELLQDLAIIKKSVFSLLIKFGIINEMGEKLVPKKLRMLKDVSQIVYEAFDNNEDTFINRVFIPLIPFATKYAHL